MTIQEELLKLRKEMRFLRQRIPQLERAWQIQKENSKKKDEIILSLKKELEETKKENKELKDKLDSTNNHRDKLVGMIFKSNTKKNSKNKKKKGGQKGHKGKCRIKPKKIDKKVHCFLTHCPHCNKKVKRSNKSYQRIVEDIPELQSVIVTQYTIEKQKCSNCKKYISAKPKNTIPYLPFGINLITLALTLKYNYRLSLNKIQEYFEINHNLDIAQGAIQNILHKTRKNFTKEYQDILEKIRKSKTKHADETGWRVKGQNNWCWLFATDKEALYTIEESRGIGVPDKILTDTPQGCLIRDDYGSYTHLKMPQQSCWTHLLRVSRDGKSEESKKLHNKLKKMFLELKEITESKFDEDLREKEYLKYQKKINKIINQKFKEKDSIQIQTRIRNQDTNLVTALLYENVPLTNNHAEQQIRPLTVQRKISGGSRSNEGARTHAVNMSIIQTLKLRGKNLSSGLKELLLGDMHRFVVERGE